MTKYIEQLPKLPKHQYTVLLRIHFAEGNGRYGQTGAILIGQEFNTAKALCNKGLLGGGDVKGVMQFGRNSYLKHYWLTNEGKEYIPAKYFQGSEFVAKQRRLKSYNA